jgi:sigma-B regulation protein RsbU (phosphoserine phosphatase)
MEMNHPLVRLVVLEGEQTRTVLIDTVPFTIGRQADRNLSLSSSQVSREHAVIHSDAEGYLIQDQGSRHGTLVNGIRTDIARLKSGDRIELGTSDVVLVFGVAQKEVPTRRFLSRIQGDASELEKLSLFLQAAQSFSNTRLLNDILSSMIEYTLRLTGAERGFVFLGDSPSSLHLELGLNKQGVVLADDSKISHSVVRDAAISGQEYFIGDVSGEGQPVGRESMVVHELMSVIAIPLRGRNSDSLLGLLYLDSRLKTSTLTSVSRDILHAIATEAANLVENARLVQAQREAELVHKELEIASSIQQSIFLKELPSFSYAKLTAKSVPCTEVGGDFYDVIPVKDGFVAVVADVSGKGMSSALLAAIIQGMMYAQLMTGASVVETLSAINNFLCCRVSGRKYVTLIAVHYIEGGRVEIVNGGHIAPIVIQSDGRAEVIEDGDIPVGLFHDATFHSIPLDLPRGARLVLMSDGLTEAENPAGEQFYSTDMTRHMAGADPIGDLFASMRSFCAGEQPRDDSTILVIDRVA